MTGRVPREVPREVLRRKRLWGILYIDLSSSFLVHRAWSLNTYLMYHMMSLGTELTGSVSVGGRLTSVPTYCVSTELTNDSKNPSLMFFDLP